MKFWDRKKKFLIPLKRQFLFIMVFLFICISLITSVTCAGYIRMHALVVRQNMELYSSQLSRSVGEMYKICRNIARTLSYNQIIQDYLATQMPEEKYSDYNLAYNQLVSMMELSPYIRDIAVLNDAGNSIAVYGAYETYASLSDTAETSGSSLSSLGKTDVEGRDCQILRMPVFSLKSSGSRLVGKLFLAVDIGAFFTENAPSDAGYIPGCLLTDSSGNIIYGDPSYSRALKASPDADQISVSGSIYYVAQEELSVVDGNFYVFISRDLFTAAGSKIAALQLCCMVLLLLMVAFVMFRIYRPLIRSLQRLTHYMVEITDGNQQNYKNGFTLSQGLVGSTEIQEIANAFNEMLLHTYDLNHTIFENYTRMYEMDINNKKTEIAYLRSQINPHFLYNTLTMICGMASAGMRQEIIDTASALSAIFRYSIKGDDIVTLREEMEIARSYLKIQTYRFEDRFTVTYDLPEEALQCMIPKMVIQPIVENAIVHGLEPSLKPGRLVIGAGRNPKKGYLAIWIFDTGIGMKPEKLQQIREELQAPVHRFAPTIMDSLNVLDSRHHDSIGILNVNSRMVLYFGMDYSLILDSEEGVGTNVQLRIPYRTKS